MHRYSNSAAKPGLVVERAVAADAHALAGTSKRAFDADVELGAPGLGGPPGYDSAGWYQGALRYGTGFKLIANGAVIGGALVFQRGPSWYEIGRIWLIPEAQSVGFGTLAMRQIEGYFSDARRWTLDTPIWNLRNQDFYATLGYQETGRDCELVYFEKRR